jgi:hypothetical protein
LRELKLFVGGISLKGGLNKHLERHEDVTGTKDALPTAHGEDMVSKQDVPREIAPYRLINR